jgi:hypothetical protein
MRRCEKAWQDGKLQKAASKNGDLRQACDHVRHSDFGDGCVHALHGKWSECVPVGVETVLSGMTPGPGRTMLFEFTTFYSANEFVDGHAKSMTTEFKRRVFANAFRAEHGWNVHLWGGTLQSNVAIPLIYPTTACSAWKIHRVWRWQHRHRGARRGVPQAQPALVLRMFRTFLPE